MRAGRERRSELHRGWRCRGAFRGTCRAALGSSVAGLTWRWCAVFGCASAQARQLLCPRVARLRWRRLRSTKNRSEVTCRRAHLGSDLTSVSAMRCVVASVMFLAIVAGAAEPREDLKPLGAISPCLFRVAVRALACRFCSLARFQPSAVSSTGAR